VRRTFRPASTIAALAVVALGATACTAGTEEKSDIGKGGVDTATTIEFWHFFTDREAKTIDAVVKDFHAKNPKITVNIKSGQDDDKMKQAISAGQPVDVGLSYSTDIVGTFCSKKAWRDLGEYIKRDDIDVNNFPPVVRDYTQYKGTRCAMPMLSDAYGLFYNTDLLKAAGYTAPPKTMTELADMAIKLTKLDAKGNIVQAGFVPKLGFYENTVGHLGPAWGAQWFKDGAPQIGTDPGWAEMLTWQKALVDKFGIAKWEKFTAGLGDEFQPDNAFHKGKVAMIIDGEFRTAFVKDQAPKIKFGTAPVPTADNHPELYGSGYVSGNIIGIGRGSKSPEAAWQLIKYLSTDTDAILKLSDGLRNVPTTQEALDRTKLKDDPIFKPFIDIFTNPKSATIPSTPNGQGPQLTFQAFADKWQHGTAKDLKGGLAGVDAQIKKDLQLAGG
jgi:multiple sugar transport system substrate-binding protein